jgi:hypothetical protein
LRHILRSTAIPTKAIREVDERPLPAAHKALEGRDITGQHSFDVSLVIASAHLDLFARPTYRRRRGLHFLEGIHQEKRNRRSRQVVPPRKC